MTSPNSVTILFASFNGMRTLPRMMRAIRELELPSGEVELVCVDNGSTDGTGDYIRHLDLPMRVTVATETARGKNRALNTGLALARGEWIVLTDDDVVPAPNWLTCLLRLASQKPGCLVFGGAITAVWPEPPSPELLNVAPLDICFGLTDPALASGPIDPKRLCGANMMVHRSVFDEGLRFNESVGPAAGHYAMGSETELLRRLEQSGHQACFAAEATVGHQIRPEQLQRDWVMQRAFRSGRGNRARDASEQPEGTSDKWRSVRLWWFSKYFRHRVHALWLATRGDRAGAYSEDWKASFMSGYIHQWWKIN